MSIPNRIHPSCCWWAPMSCWPPWSPCTPTWSPQTPAPLDSKFWIPPSSGYWAIFWSSACWPPSPSGCSTRIWDKKLWLKVKHRKNCECCPGHSLCHDNSISNCQIAIFVIKSLNRSQCLFVFVLFIYNIQYIHLWALSLYMFSSLYLSFSSSWS